MNQSDSALPRTGRRLYLIGSLTTATGLTNKNLTEATVCQATVLLFSRIHEVRH